MRNLTIAVTLAVAAACAPVPSAVGPPAVLTTPSDWAVTGMFSETGDGASFEACDSGRPLPVSVAADYVTLERAYAAARKAPGEPVLAVVEGRVESRLVGYGWPQNAWVIDRVVKLQPGDACPPPPTWR